MTTTTLEQSKDLVTLYHQGKAGAIYSWRVWTEGADIVTEYGQVDGEKQLARKTATPKNIGRSNATTAEEQATIEAQAMWQHKRDRKYAESLVAAQDVLVRPMLALDFEKRKNRNVTYPTFVQPKLDGVRALAFWNDDCIEIMSRSGKDWRVRGSIEHIVHALEALLPKHLLFDGEIYVPGTFQQNTRLVTKYRPGISEQLVFNVYDVIDRDNLNEPFSGRLSNLYWLEQQIQAASNKPPLGIVSTVVANSEEQVYAFQKQFVNDGFEGAIVRLEQGAYQYGARSMDLLKVKSFKDKEFPIIGHKDGVGKFQSAVIWVCRMEDGKTFDVVPRGTMEERRQWFQEGEAHYGEMLNVRYFETTEDGIPRFPVGAGIRAPEDVNYPGLKAGV